MLPKLYAVSMMWTLNARQELRDLPWGNSSTLSYISFPKPSRSITNEPIQAETVCIFSLVILIAKATFYEDSL